MYNILFLFFLFFLKDLIADDKLFKIDYVELKAYKLTTEIEGNKVRGKDIFVSRKVNCLSCHQAPLKEEKFHGNFGPSLVGVGAKYSREQLRLIIINSKIINPTTIMPAYYKNIIYPRTPKEHLNKTILSFQEVEDVLEYIYTFKEDAK